MKDAPYDWVAPVIAVSISLGAFCVCASLLVWAAVTFADVGRAAVLFFSGFAIGEIRGIRRANGLLGKQGGQMGKLLTVSLSERECGALTLLVQSTTGVLMEKMEKMPDDLDKFTPLEMALIRAMSDAKSPYVKIAKVGEAWAEKRGAE